MLKVRKTFPVVDLSLESMSNTTITIQIRKLSSLPFNKINNKSSHPSLDNSTNFASALLIITSLFPIYHFYFWWDLSSNHSKREIISGMQNYKMLYFRY